jgi:hypothetical protein
MVNKICQDFDRFSCIEPPEYKKVVFGMSPLCMYCMCALLALEQFGGFYSYSVFSGFSVIDWCPVNMNIPA